VSDILYEHLCFLLRFDFFFLKLAKTKTKMNNICQHSNCNTHGPLTATADAMKGSFKNDVYIAKDVLCSFLFCFVGCWWYVVFVLCSVLVILGKVVGGVGC
jgi:hypothetical protein